MDYYSCKLLVFLVLTRFTASVTSFTICLNSGNYTAGSTYSANLNGVLLTITASVNNTGFNYAFFGQNPDRVFALLLCRADVSLDDCQNCKATAVLEIQSTCPNQKQAASWQEHCTLRYSNHTVYGNPQTIYRFFGWNVQNATNPSRFQQDLSNLLADLRIKAANGGDSMKAAAGNASTSDLQTIFAMVQCTPDLSAKDCSSCLISAGEDIPNFCDRKVGCRILLESCFLRYETRPFYNETRMRELAMPLSSVPDVITPPPTGVPPEITPPPTGSNETRTVKISAAVSVAIVALAIFAIAGYIILKKRRIRQQGLNLLENATNDFSDENKLGQGGFGTVYKGKLSDGQQIAVKRLSKTSGQGELEFKNEVLLLARLQHRNLVKLLGFALEGSEKLLVYEFVQNASLDKFIFDPVKRLQLDWDRRRKIIGGIARGILYLHEDSRLRIIHRDLKAANVLLDSEMNPKIADFGMARLFLQNDQTQGSTNRIVGTHGYMAPEYAMHGQFSIKSDVFSFGVLLLEVVCGQKNTCFVNEDESFQDLPSFAWKNWREGTCMNVIDPILKLDSGSIRETSRCIHIGLLCVQDRAADRPTMASVVLMLSSLSTDLALPSEPAFFVQGIGYESNARKFDINASSSFVKSARSTNEASISELYPR